MKGGAPAAEVAFTAAQLAAGTAPQLHTAFVSALARCWELSQARRPSSQLAVPVIGVHVVVLPSVRPCKQPGASAAPNPMSCILIVSPQALGALEDYVEVLPRPAPHATGPLPGVLAANVAAEPAAGGPEAAGSTATSAAATAAATARDGLQQAVGIAVDSSQPYIHVTAPRLPGGLASSRYRAQPAQAARVHSLLALAVSELASAAEATADAATARAAIDVLLQVHLV